MNQIWKGWIKVLRGVEGLVLRTIGAVMGTAETAVTVIVLGIDWRWVLGLNLVKYRRTNLARVSVLLGKFLGF